jgi:hypothetical protein
MRSIILVLIVRARFIVWLVVGGAGGLVGCVRTDGGSVEASWVLRTFDGRAISRCSCSDPEISRIRLVVAPVGPDGTVGADVCAGRSDCEFSCTNQGGATSFFVSPGSYAISVAPLGVEGEILAGEPPYGAGVRVPAPILRDVVFGRPTQVDAVAIESGCSASCNGEQSNRVCTRD